MGRAEVTSLIGEEGPGALPLRRLLAAILEGETRVDALVARTGAPRRSAEAMLRAVEPGGDYADLLPRAPRVVPFADVEAIVAGAPPPLRDLDHVPATPETVRRRAQWLAETYDLAGARVLFLGDHDCTALALALVAEPAEIAVVDVDQRVLEYAAGRVHTLFADLRIGLPESARERYDLVFTDPPYTPEGVGLFCARGVGALRDHRTGRLLVAYGHPPAQPVLGLKVQRELAALDLAYEAVLPGFNEYAGAQAIGSRAAQYVLRPTRRSGPLAARRAARYAEALYTHGRQAVEAGGEGASPAALVGSPSTEHPERVDLRPFYGRCLVQASLAAGSPALEVVVDNDTEGVRSADEQARFAAVLRPVYRVAELARSHAGTRDTVIRLERAERAGPLAAYVFSRPHGRVGNTWREGLIQAAGPLTKNEARARVEAAVHDRAILGDRLLDLPVHALLALQDDLLTS